jgi:polyphenol oxidase
LNHPCRYPKPLPLHSGSTKLMLERLTSQSLTVPHGFYTRKGGASSGIFAGLNCGLGSTDQTEIVTINRARVAGDMGVAPDRLVTLHQVHSDRVVVVDGPMPDRPEADALVTAQPGLLLGILTADCQPVLFADPEARVVGAAHAGWKGVERGVLESTVAAMVGLGATAGRIVAVIGPTISQDAYEVGPDFRQTFVDSDGTAARHFRKGRDDRWQFDLPGLGLERLRAAGIGRVEWTGHCTYADADRFYSYRRATHEGAADYGRFLSVIRL